MLWRIASLIIRVMVAAFSLSVLVLAFFLQLVGSRPGLSLERIVRAVFVISVCAVILYFTYLTVLQYMVWEDASLSEYFLPPHQSIWYLLNYHFVRFGIYYLISFVAAVILLFISRKLNKRFGYKFFNDEESYIAALSIFLLGNHNWGYAWIYYIAAILIIAALITGYRLLITKENKRFSLYWLWLPVAILAILIQGVL